MLLTLFFWLWLIPLAIGVTARGWGTCLGLVVSYLALFSLNSVITAVGTIHSAEGAATLINDDLMILAVTTAAHGLRQAFLEDR